MDKENNNITIIGAGSIGTALGNVLARKRIYNISLLSIEKDVVDSINKNRNNHKYFPNIKLSKHLKATTDVKLLKNAQIVFLAIPSNIVVDYISAIKPFLHSNTILLNLAKGFSTDNRTVLESLAEIVDNPVCTFKGPTFANELINRVPTAFTLGSKNESHYDIFLDIFQDTNVHIDFSEDVIGVEILSILKNIYAIATGILDAQYNSANLRFLFLTKAFNEMKDILLEFGGQEETMFKYCGYGDFGLTALNDLSRNRTLGLLIGKGFFVEDISDKVTLEGKIAVNVFCNKISKSGALKSHYPIMAELYKVFNEDYKVSNLLNKILNI